MRLGYKSLFVKSITKAGIYTAFYIYIACYNLYSLIAYDSVFKQIQVRGAVGHIRLWYSYCDVRNYLRYLFVFTYIPYSDTLKYELIIFILYNTFIPAEASIHSGYNSIRICRAV